MIIEVTSCRYRSFAKLLSQNIESFTRYLWRNYLRYSTYQLRLTCTQHRGAWRILFTTATYLCRSKCFRRYTWQHLRPRHSGMARSALCLLYLFSQCIAIHQAEGMICIRHSNLPRHFVIHSAEQFWLSNFSHGANLTMISDNEFEKKSKFKCTLRDVNACKLYNWIQNNRYICIVNITFN